MQKGIVKPSRQQDMKKNEPTNIQSKQPTDVPSAVPLEDQKEQSEVKGESTTKVPPSPTPQTQTDSSWYYPNSTVKSSSGNNLSLESNDNSDAITEWYKNKIRGMNMNTKTFVKTNSNGNILNKLDGVGQGTEVRVEISRQRDQPLTKITVSL